MPALALYKKNKLITTANIEENEQNIQKKKLLDEIYNSLHEINATKTNVDIYLLASLLQLPPTERHLHRVILQWFIYKKSTLITTKMIEEFSLFLLRIFQISTFDNFLKDDKNSSEGVKK